MNFSASLGLHQLLDVSNELSRFCRLLYVFATCVIGMLGLPVSVAATEKPVVSWIVLGEQGQAVVRSLTYEGHCPLLKQDGKSAPMRVRAKPETVAQRPTASDEKDSKASDFAVLTCEAALSANTKKADVDGVAIPIPKAIPQRIVVLGDTGCRMKKADDAFQACNDAQKWAFAEVIKKAVSLHPDLVIHVGDYHYRENPCPEGNMGCKGSPWGYGYDVWYADFFEPAKPLLLAAPWVMVRGNHESCVRAGQGYWRFLDPRPYVKGRDCNQEKFDMIGDYSSPYAIPLGKSGGMSSQLIVFDTAKVPGKKVSKDDPARVIYAQQFAQVEQFSQNADFNIFMNHHPILGFAASHKEDGSVEFKPGNQVLQAIMQERQPQRLFPAGIKAVLSGHVHLFQAVTYTTDHPTQFGSGNGGTAMDSALPDELPAGTTPFPNAVVDHFSNSNRDGFLLLERKANQWRMTAYDIAGKAMTQCLMDGTESKCSVLNK